jgi:hypothetical protein
MSFTRNASLRSRSAKFKPYLAGQAGPVTPKGYLDTISCDVTPFEVVCHRFTRTETTMAFAQTLEEAKRTLKLVEHVSLDDAIKLLHDCQVCHGEQAKVQDSKQQFKPVVTIVRNPDDPRHILGVYMSEAMS